MKKPITTTLAYLIGVPDRHFGMEYDSPETLEENLNAKTVRYLSIVRNTLLMQNGAISNHIRYNLYANIDEFIEPSILDFLETRGVQLIQPQPRVNEIIASLNRLIPERVDECRDLFPGIEWRFVKRLFTMGRDIEAVVNEMHLRKKSFPFQCYINWPIRNPKAYPLGRAIGNVLEEDKTFLKLLYMINDAVLPEPKNDLKNFLSEAGQAVLAVDCENSDPYKLCAAMWELKAEDPQSFLKIKKTVLFDDVHTNPAWKLLNDFLPVPVEHILTQRVNDHKSLVDIQMTAGVAKEHYVEGVDSFLLASSDSDYWGLIKSLPTARFMVLMEQEKVGDCLRDALDESGIGYCSLDKADTERIKAEALDAGIRKRLDGIRVNVAEMITEVIESMRVDLDEEYLRSLEGRLTVEVTEGTLRIGLA